MRVSVLIKLYRYALWRHNKIQVSFITKHKPQTEGSKYLERVNICTDGGWVKQTDKVSELAKSIATSELES